MLRVGACAFPLLLLAASRDVAAQARTEAGGTTAWAPACVARATSFPSGAPGGLDASVAPWVVSTTGGVLVAYRTQSGALRVASLQRSLERGRIDRELARQAGPFAMVAAPEGGAMLVMLVRSHVPGGEDSVLIGHLSPTGEARNVPRELGRGALVDGVSIDAVRGGFAVAWGVASAGTFAVLTDGRGVPITPLRRVTETTSMPWVVGDPGDPGVARVRARRVGSGGTETLVLGADGAPSERVAWPDGVGLAVAMNNDRRVFGLLDDGSADATTAWALGAREQDGTTGVTPLQPHLPHPSTVTALRGTSDGVLAVLDEGPTHESLFRIALDGTTVLLTTWAGSHGSVATVTDTSLVVVGHDPQRSARGELAVVAVTCPRRAASADAWSSPSPASR